jgi:hypothetical protein
VSISTATATNQGCCQHLDLVASHQAQLSHWLYSSKSVEPFQLCLRADRTGEGVGCRGEGGGCCLCCCCSRYEKTELGQKKNGFVCCFYLCVCFLEKKTISGSRLRAPAKPVFFCPFQAARRRSFAPPPSRAPPPPPPGAVIPRQGGKIGFNVRSCASLLYLSPFGDSLWRWCLSPFGES